MSETSEQSYFSLPHDDHLKNREEFSPVLRGGQHVDDCGVRLSFRVNDLERSRIGFIVGKKVGSAPTRHRWRRLWKEAFRLERPDFQQHIDLVVQVRPKTKPLSLETMREMLRQNLHIDV